MPVSSSSNSEPWPPRRRFSSDQPAVGKLGLRILVEELHVRVRRRVVEVEVVLLDVLAVVALDGREAEQPLLQDGVVAVPEGGGEDEELIAVAECRRCRPRPSGTPCCAPGRAAGSPRRCRRRCSPRGQWPRSGRRRRGPSGASRGYRPGFVASGRVRACS